MFQFFLRAWTHTNFKARSTARDATSDHSRLEAVASAIGNAIAAAEAERAGLDRRLEDVLSRAAVTFGNGTSEYLEREALDSHHQDLFGADIMNGQRRLADLATQIAHLNFLRTAMMTRFPDFKSSPDSALH